MQNSELINQDLKIIDSANSVDEAGDDSKGAKGPRRTSRWCKKVYFLIKSSTVFDFYI